MALDRSLYVAMFRLYRECHLRSSRTVYSRSRARVCVHVCMCENEFMWADERKNVQYVNCMSALLSLSHVSILRCVPKLMAYACACICIVCIGLCVAKLRSFKHTQHTHICFAQSLIIISPLVWNSMGRVKLINAIHKCFFSRLPIYSKNMDWYLNKKLKNCTSNNICLHILGLLYLSNF